MAPQWIIFHSSLSNVFTKTLLQLHAHTYILMYSMFYNSLSSEISFLFLKPI